MKKYLVIGNPINHSLSPKLHNHWIKEHNIDAIYEKKKIEENDIKDVINELRKEKIHGINVTVPYKKKILVYLDQLTPKASMTQSVNTIFKKKKALVGDNTDIGGFELSLKNINYAVKDKKIFILGAGGVAPSIILGLKRSGATDISISNRSKEKIQDLKKIHPKLKMIEWGKTSDFDMIINATSLGLKNDDKIKLDFTKNGPGKLFYDIIYNPEKTNFLLQGKKLGNQIENGKMMFLYQAQLAFKIWHNILPKVHNKLLDS